MIAVHIVAVLLMSVIERENLAQAMITGDKPSERHPGAVDAKPPRAFGVVFALLAIAGAVYTILQYDPQGFALRSAEAFEHRSDAGFADISDKPENDERD